jgi:hypothetical protein
LTTVVQGHRRVGRARRGQVGACDLGQFRRARLRHVQFGQCHWQCHGAVERGHVENRRVVTAFERELHQQAISHMFAMQALRHTTRLCQAQRHRMGQ